MVQLLENQIVITIPSPSPAETLAEMQSGIIEIVKTLLAMGAEGKDLELDRPTANGGYFALELLQATLFDAATVEAAQALATGIQDRANRNA